MLQFELEDAGCTSAATLQQDWECTAVPVIAILLKRYFYVTLLREPVSRYLSEFKHVQRGATWKASRHWCAGHEATSAELPPCYEGEDWSDVPLEEFLSCPYNLANNRQTRMLADLSLVGCYNLSRMPAPQRDAMMLASAKQNLEHMASFGITATQKKNQYIFEETFNLRFDVPFEQYEKNSTYSGMTEHQLDDEILNSIRCINHLDVELYKFAAQLLEQRFRVLSTHDAQFEEHFNSLGSPLL
ncbi:unnamed protein product [Darwinula stevensoni]|uniref:Heparan-sulfate 6-O-sulfotransferase n=1 Tax=Darwinula stevensoni TaxID=69355 RepID=A0A7R8XJ78_9CRUS|nr:unnamed protein product [Darwinula stevensoni]CAG0891938.1 unnamed protein product [Darwinula stevensoni]